MVVVHSTRAHTHRGWKDQNRQQPKRRRRRNTKRDKLRNQPNDQPGGSQISAKDFYSSRCRAEAAASLLGGATSVRTGQTGTHVTHTFLFWALPFPTTLLYAAFGRSGGDGPNTIEWKISCYQVQVSRWGTINRRAYYTLPASNKVLLIATCKRNNIIGVGSNRHRRR